MLYAVVVEAATGMLSETSARCTFAAKFKSRINELGALDTICSSQEGRPDFLVAQAVLLD